MSDEAEFELDNFGSEKDSDQGTHPAVAMSGNMLVEVAMYGTTLYSKVGLVKSNETIHWGPIPKYDKGLYPKVAVNSDGWVVEVHQSQNHNTLWWRVGVVKNIHTPEIACVEWFGKAKEFCHGLRPSVALNNQGKVVVVYSSDSLFSNTLHYRLGHIEMAKNSMYLSKSEGKVASSGKFSSLALTEDGRLIVVYADGDQLWYNTGSIGGERINFEGALQYDTGKMPSVAINSKGKVIEVHKSENHDTLWYHKGTISGLYQRSREYGVGRSPSIATGYKDGQCYYVAAHHKSDSSHLWRHVRKIGAQAEASAVSTQELESKAAAVVSQESDPGMLSTTLIHCN